MRVNNLRRIDLDLPRQHLVVICGVSGSGKTSLALDTLYAEGQRRYIESFSAYTRQFLERLEKPAADRIEGIPPAIAVVRHNKNSALSSRSTVGTVTETVEYLRLLFAKVGHIVCCDCNLEVSRDTPQSVAERIPSSANSGRLMIAFPLLVENEGQLGVVRQSLLEDGFVRVIVGNTTIDLSQGANHTFDGVADTSIEMFAVVDRLSARTDTVHRLRDSLETAFEKGHGECSVFIEGTFGGDQREIDGRTWSCRQFSDGLRCDGCGHQYPEPEPRLFSYNSSLGACPACEGCGSTSDADGRWRIYRTCEECRGTRLRPEVLATRIQDIHIAEVCQYTITDARQWFLALTLNNEERNVAQLLLDQIINRMEFLDAVGLGYLTLDRSIRSLSGGEAQRVSLTSALGSDLVNMLYVLDEPSVGLHPCEVQRLLDCVVRLRNRGNSVVVVEHEDSFLKSADDIIEIGPEAGNQGGQIVFQGTPNEMLASHTSLTGAYLAGMRGTSIPDRRRPLNQGRVRLTGARGNNLQNLSVDFPLGVLCLITGVSGSGKSTLIQDTLYPALADRLHKDAPQPCDYDDVFGAGQLEDVVLVDETPIGRTPRSNPVTYVKAFDKIRAVFADVLEARTHNYTASHFSFNVDGGRCETCRGDGFLRIDMQFMPDVFMKCSQCQGRRYRKEILEVAYRGKNIAEVLEMTAREAFTFFRGQANTQKKLKQLLDVGLDYLRLGQPANTLSCGEAQRLKLAGYLGMAKRGRTLFLLDEPSTGLHFSDVVKLLDCFNALLSIGYSLIVIEHNVQIMKAADHIIDLGLGAADEGGRIVAEGTPEDIAQSRDSATGRCLAKAFGETMAG